DGVGKSVWADSLRKLRFGGRLVTLTVPIPQEPSSKFRFFSKAIAGMAAGNVRALPVGKRLLMTRVKPRGGDLEKITALIEAGKIRPRIDKGFPFEQIADAHRTSEMGHVRGKIVVRVSSLANGNWQIARLPADE